MSALPRPRAQATILVVENSVLVRKLTCRVLSDEGFTALPAAGGAEALTLAATTPEKIDLLLTDVRMQPMNGPDLAVRLSALQPSIAVLLMSGDAQHMIEKLGYPSIQKPFSPEELVAKVKPLIDGASAQPEKS